MRIRKFLYLVIPLICVSGLFFMLDFKEDAGKLSEKDYSKLSMVELHNLAQKDDAQAQGMLAYYYQEGIQVEVDYEASMNWYLKSVKNGNTAAMVNLAYLYGNGIGVEKDETKAFEWNLKAAKDGDASGMFNIGKKYEYGIGVAKDEKKAHYWLEKAEKAKESI